MTRATASASKSSFEKIQPQTEPLRELLDGRKNPGRELDPRGREGSAASCRALDRRDAKPRVHVRSRGN